MRYVIYVAVCFLALLGANRDVFAGSPDGLILAVTWTSEAEPYIANAQGFFKRYDTSGGVHACNGDQLNIESAAFKLDARKINDGIVVSAVSSPSKRKKLGSVLIKYRDKDHAQGFDGVLAIAREGDALILQGISAFAAEPVHTARIGIADVVRPAALDMAICKVLIELPTMREP